MAVGRRREAVARVRLYSTTLTKVQVGEKELKKGDILVNDKPINKYFSFLGYANRYNSIFEETGTAGKLIISIKVAGGGQSGQLDAAIHGIARVLDKLDSEKYHKLLREKGYLTRDPRTRERRKVGMGGKARRKKQSPKR
ncbi:MAG: 30S ribosomal protein S9 [Candidatus Levybacteria bacterium CG10_big_fil_rev_8_21_14_0_10_36_7]|nr:MAG: 30S ribosomal protein S9 [Candidatus Levybacteria bacterium CG10_big_fil_rev_8_21_14_0_10_36_7]